VLLLVLLAPSQAFIGAQVLLLGMLCLLLVTCIACSFTQSIRALHSPETSVNFSCIKSQKIVLFIIITVRTAKPFLMFLCQIFLGEGAIKGEEHIIQVESVGRAGDMSMPIARLQRGSVENFPLKVRFSDSPVRFQLIKGSGPVHVIGTHTFGKLALIVRN
jgi:hypothetical protein